ncbi:MAG: hypothetical protein ACK5OS_02070 [Chryseotalea sp.]
MRRTKLAKFLRYTFPVGVRIVFGLLFSITLVMVALEFIAIQVKCDTCPPVGKYAFTFTIACLLTHVYMSYVKFKQYTSHDQRRN